jgi:SAM-dependent methyltransferase
MRLITEQQNIYETAYGAPASEFGLPDRKIADGRVLTGKRILALGCGTGNDVWYLAHDNQVIGLDYAGSGLDIARRHGMETRAADLNHDPTLPFDDNSFDVVVCKDILEHLIEPILVLREVRRILKPEGYAVISVPNHFALPMRLRILFGRGIIYRSLLGSHHEFEEWNYMHIRFFTYQGFRSFLTAGGVTPEKWFWDFGNLAHYHDPDMWFEPQLWKQSQGIPLSNRGRFGLSVLRPLWRCFNVIVPRPLRRAIVSMSPNLLCGGFYVRCVKASGPCIHER